MVVVVVVVVVETKSIKFETSCDGQVDVMKN